MKNTVKHRIIAILVLFVSAFVACDEPNGNDNGSNGNGDTTTTYTPGTYLTQTLWNQNSPFNDLMSEVYGKTVLTGCGNTAVAMIMKYHQWPLNISGTIPEYDLRSWLSDESSGVTTGSPIERVNFSYDWANMLNNYNDGAGTEAQRNAVATLFLHVSAARDTSGLPHYIKISRFFDYDESVIRIYRRGQYDRPEGLANDSILPDIWDEILRLQIDRLLPVYYWGWNQNRTVDHAFVLDGYDNNGRFHVNWGWGGNRNGWRYTTNLITDEYDETSNNYSFDNHADINIMPSLNGTGTDDLRIFGRNLSLSIYTVKHGEVFTVNPTIYNVGTAVSPRGKVLGIGLFTSENQFRIIGEIQLEGVLPFTRARAQGNYTAAQLRQDFTLEVPAIIPSDVPSGNYVLKTLIKNDNGEWVVMGTVNDYTNQAAINVVEGTPDIDLIGMVRINGGTFSMGSPADEAERGNIETQRQVTVSSFYIGQYQVTQKEYEEIMEVNPSSWIGSDLPVNRVSWYDAIEYCNRRSQIEGLTPAYTIDKSREDPNSTGDDELKWVVTWNRNANGYRLPTEAEWEYACRAGTTTPFSTGNNITTDQANYNGTNPYNNNAEGIYRARIIEVGSFPANAWGLYDMHGNVWEWCWDWYGAYESGTQIDPTGRSSGSGRVTRGGSYYSSGRQVRSAYREGHIPSQQYIIFGFRVVRSY